MAYDDDNKKMKESLRVSFLTLYFLLTNLLTHYSLVFARGMTLKVRFAVHCVKNDVMHTSEKCNCIQGSVDVDTCPPSDKFSTTSALSDAGQMIQNRRPVRNRR